ncbi:hypothetical protein BT63DRAFT_451089 [Microthyrium microscopicum]|uniref:Uncharacterized protein n=1 Tax=Microthyrium microscopicum TaxID=703497 RepID=A0A6A6UNI8_9PEZI|nr:hypothetical protein BT63DRAFT_451089 [Microthyrium microscopicum]
MPLCRPFKGLINRWCSLKIAVKNLYSSNCPSIFSQPSLPIPSSRTVASPKMPRRSGTTIRWADMVETGEPEYTESATRPINIPHKRMIYDEDHGIMRKTCQHRKEDELPIAMCFVPYFNEVDLPEDATIHRTAWPNWPLTASLESSIPRKQLLTIGKCIDNMDNKHLHNFNVPAYPVGLGPPLPHFERPVIGYSNDTDNESAVLDDDDDDDDYDNENGWESTPQEYKPLLWHQLVVDANKKGKTPRVPPRPARFMMAGIPNSSRMNQGLKDVSSFKEDDEQSVAGAPLTPEASVSPWNPSAFRLMNGDGL